MAVGPAGYPIWFSLRLTQDICCTSNVVQRDSSWANSTAISTVPTPSAVMEWQFDGPTLCTVMDHSRRRSAAWPLMLRIPSPRSFMGFKWGTGYKGGHSPPSRLASTPSSSLSPEIKKPSVFVFILSVAVAPPVATRLPKHPLPTVMASGSSSKKGQSNRAWLGSEICDDHIEALRHRCMLPPASLVTVRIPEAEAAHTPQEGEIVVFDKDFYWGIGLPATTFFSNFLTFFGLQPHHLAPNAILQLASFVVLCEGFMRIEPRLDLWQSQFFLKQQSKKMDKAELDKLDGPRPMTPCGATLVHHRSKSGFPQLPLQESIKQWQKGFFCVKNASLAHDALNMPPFAIEPPMAKLNWQAK
ncbi:hypothetical protein D1007_23103 [Hordeum vulgare]|nr:hypothetical protein D1007_23103 [Hordeum vulgare]